jgi:hypothetical protein
MAKFCQNRWRATYWFLAGLCSIPAMGIAILVEKRPVELVEADRRIDWLGATLFVAEFILLFFPLSQARSTKHGWGTDCAYDLSFLGKELRILT